MKVLVLRAIAENEQDVEIVMIAKGLSISPIVTIKGAACYINGNPYCVYGDAVAEYTGIPKFSCNITCAKFTSGNLHGWYDN